jgi:hypothetical protein
MSELKPTNAYLGMNLGAVISQVKPGQVTYALNAVVSAADGNSITYQNEPANTLCFNLPTGYTVIGRLPIIEKNLTVYWLVNETTGDSEIGVATNCVYTPKINSKCLNFSMDDPILKAVHRVTSCSTEVYWPSKRNPRRYIDLDNLPYTEVIQGTGENPCDVVRTPEVDCNKLSVQPNFSIPLIDYKAVESEGTLLAGTYQFAFQYSNSLGEGYTSYYSITNPIPIYDPFRVTGDFNYPVGKSIVAEITSIDTTGIFDYFNIAVIKTVNNISSVDIVGTFQIQSSIHKVVYTGQSKSGIQVSIDDIFEKFPTYDTAGDVTSLQDILVWADMTTTERISYQSIASQITPEWVSWKLPKSKKQYADEINAADLRGYMRDEVYALDIVFLLKNGHQTDRFSLIGRSPTAQDLQLVDNHDSNFEQEICDDPEPKPYWKVYNTASVSGIDPAFDPNDECYQGPYQYGKFAYWESTDTYPCNSEVWGTLQGQPIRHFKFPDSAVSPHHDNEGNIYPLGIRVNVRQIYDLIRASSLTQEQKEAIEGFKIVRGNRANNKSVIAKGLLFNVGEYTKKGSTYFYPNYPFNDLREDPFISADSNDRASTDIYISLEEQQNSAGSETTLYDSLIPAESWKEVGDIITATYNGRFAGGNSKKTLRVYFDNGQIYNSGLLNVDGTNTFILSLQLRRSPDGRIDMINKLQIFGAAPTTTTTSNSLNNVNFLAVHHIKLTAESVDFGNPSTAASGDITGTSAEVTYKAAPGSASGSNLLNGFDSEGSRQRFTFHSPDTAFYQPFPGNILKLETVEYGSTNSHFVEVKKHAKYAFPSLQSYIVSLGVGVAVGFASGTYGLSTNPFSGTAAFTAFNIMQDIIFRLLPKRSMSYQFNSVGNYTTTKPIVNNTGNKIRRLDIATYLPSGMQGVGDTHIINNYQRESSIYLRTTHTLPDPHSIVGVPEDNSRFTLGDVSCQDQMYTRSISAYYSSIKNIAPDQYGQIYSYQAVDTGFQYKIDITKEFTGSATADVFGGDTFINKFAFKRKLPFFLDNRVNFPDGADVFYDELGNIGYPKYWFSTDVRRGDGGNFNIGSLFGVKVNNFDCSNNAFFYDAGKIYLFAYGIVNFFVESQVNVDLRQAYNITEGDFYPRVGTDIPDDWLQESFVPIAFDNTYTYNKTFSKQNSENVFTTLPVDFIPGQLCKESLPNRAIYSERQQDVINYKRNNWLIYRPVSYFDFPLNFGKLISVDGIETRQLLARFEDKTLLYNALLTAQSSIADVYLGQQIFNSNVPPVDFAETDTGYAGTQNKMLIKTEYGHVTVDAKRGQILLFGGRNPIDLGGEEMTLYFTRNLSFKILESFPDYPIDNNFKGVGIHGVYDTYYDRIIITKLDYKLINPNVIYNAQNGKFTLDGIEVQLSDSRYFCNTSFTVSYNLLTRSWISFHTYLPVFYVPDIKKFYSSMGDSVWVHNTVLDTYNTFYGTVKPYILEYPLAFKFQDEILQCIKDFTKVNKVTDIQTFVQTDNVFFNKVMVYNDQQHSGVRNLLPKPKNNMASYLQYPRINSDSVDILFVKSNNFYNYNGFWDVVKDQEQPIWGPACESLSIDKVLNLNNLQYSGRSFKKYPITAKDSRVRHILDNRGDVRLTSQFVIEEVQTSYK